jgi:hypothetical protein
MGRENLESRIPQTSYIGLIRLGGAVASLGFAAATTMRQDGTGVREGVQVCRLPAPRTGGTRGVVKKCMLAGLG